MHLLLSCKNFILTPPLGITLAEVILWIRNLVTICVSILVAMLALVSISLLLQPSKPAVAAQYLTTIDDVMEKLKEVHRDVKEILRDLHEMNVTLAGDHSEIMAVLSNISEALEELSNALGDLGESMELLNKTRPELVKNITDAIEKLIVAVNETLKEFREDLEALRDARMTLVRVQAVAGIIAERAYEEAEAGNLTRAEELANVALNLTHRVIQAYHEKALVLQEYVEAFRKFCEAIYILSEAIKNIAAVAAAAA